VIIECKECRTKYRFDESQIEGKGIRVRCTRCQHVFFQENPSADTALLADILQTEEKSEKEKRGAEDLAKTLKELGVESDNHEPDRWEEETISLPNDDRKAEDIPPEGEPKTTKKVSKILPRIVLFLFLILIATGVYLWFFPGESSELFDKIKTVVPIEKFFTTTKSGTGIEAMKEGIIFSEVKERILKNWFIGNVLIVDGVVVNNNTFPVAEIKVRSKILDSSGKVLAQREAYGDNMLSDEELRNLTEKELYEELGTPKGRNGTDGNIPSLGKAPFMIVFPTPPKEAAEFIVELADIKTIEG
jgi:predicted Zn finger-like uncharacterized protein